MVSSWWVVIGLSYCCLVVSVVLISVCVVVVFIMKFLGRLGGVFISVVCVLW